MKCNQDYTHIICDLSDVIVKGLEGSESKISAYLNEDIKEVRNKLFSYNFNDLWLGKKREFDFFDLLIKEFNWKINTNELLGIIRSNFQEINGSKEVFRELSKHYKLILLSVNPVEWAEYYLNKFKLNEIFRDDIYFSYQIGYTKREQESFMYIIEKYKINPSNILFIDDSKRNNSIAKSIGITGICFQNPIQLTIELSKLNIKGAEEILRKLLLNKVEESLNSIIISRENIEIRENTELTSDLSAKIGYMDRLFIILEEYFNISIRHFVIENPVFFKVSDLLDVMIREIKKKQLKSALIN
ncbi:HAD hydrolase-like protein [Bacillus cereus]